MSGGTITRVCKGNFFTELSGGMECYTDVFKIDAGGTSYVGGKNGTSIGKPEKPKIGKYFQRGWWTDESDKPIKEALIGQKVKFHIQMDKTKVPQGSVITFQLKDWDGAVNIDDDITLTSMDKGKSLEIKTLKTDSSGKASLIINLTKGLIRFIEEEDNEIELYFYCSYYDESDKELETLDLPDDTDDYLIVYEKEVLITVFIELPHSKETGWGAKGLAGHSAMAIGERYFDYGPNNTPGTYSEKQYDADFNDDGDKNDLVRLDTPSFKNSPGMPWWGTHIAILNGIKPEDVTLDMVIKHIGLDWYDDGTNIYGKVHKVEFYVKESEANKMILWWEERYKHLKVYSVFPWTGEQCTTTVKSAIQEAFSFKMIESNVNYISDDTQKPSGLLSELGKFISTSKKHYGEKAKTTILKHEDSNWPNP